MWARVEDNKIVEYYNQKKSLILNNVRYSSQIFTIWTDEERAALGIYPVIEPSHVDSKFHYESNVVYTFNEEQQKVIGTIETATITNKTLSTSLSLAFITGHNTI